MNVRVVIGLEQQELVLLEAGVVLKRQDGLQGEVVVRVDKVLLENVLIDFVLLCKINNPISFSFLYVFCSTNLQDKTHVQPVYSKGFTLGPIL